MEETFGIVVIVVAVVGVLVAILTLVSSSSAYDEIGRGNLALEEQQRREPAPGTPAARAEQESEMRDILESRNARRARRGEPPVDVEAEIARLRAENAEEIVVDDDLRAEIRDLVVASNARRERRGQPPLDVDDEVERRIHDLQA